MDLNAAHELARAIMDRNGLQDWTFQFDHAKRRLGQCQTTRRAITMSRYFVSAASEEQVTQTMLHEVAHALTPGHHHDRVWLVMARSLGYHGSRLSRNPYLEAQRAAQGVTTNSDRPPVNAKVGDVVELRDGRSGRVEAKTNASYVIDVAGTRYRYRASAVVGVIEHGEAPQRLKRGADVAFVHAGRKYRARIVRVNQTTYSVASDSWNGRIPFHLIEPD